MWSTPGFWNRFLWCRNIIFCHWHKYRIIFNCKYILISYSICSKLYLISLKTTTHSVMQSFLWKHCQLDNQCVNPRLYPSFGGSCFPISVGSIYKWQDQFWRSQVWMLFFFAAIHIRRWSLNIPLTPCSISSCSLVKNVFFLFGCVCVKELVFLELSYYEGDKELTKKTCISPISHRWFAEFVSATGWGGHVETGIIWNNPWYLLSSIFPPIFMDQSPMGSNTSNPLRDQLKSPERWDQILPLKNPVRPCDFCL